jgi:hypothetical protein
VVLCICQFSSSVIKDVKAEVNLENISEADIPLYDVRLK